MSEIGGIPRPGGGAVIGGVLGGGAVIGGGAVGGGLAAGRDDPGTEQNTSAGTAHPDSLPGLGMLPLTGSPAAQLALVGAGIVLLGIVLVVGLAIAVRLGWRSGRDVSTR